jgi:hypothetical protein
MDLMFEVPDDPDFKPWLLEYKVNARTEILPSMNETDGKPESKERPGNSAGSNDRPDRSPPRPGSDGTSTPRPPANKTTPPPPPSDPKGRVHGWNIAEKEPVFSDRLPFKTALTGYGTATDLEFKERGTLRGVKGLTAVLDANWQPKPGTKQPIERFEVPDGMHLLQVSLDPTRPGSTYGQALNFARVKLQDIYVVDASGDRYRPVGTYGMAMVGGQPTFELTFLNDLERDMVRIPEFRKIKRNDFKGKFGWVWLFHIPPGTRIDKFHTGKNLDLSRFNLVAPR